MVKTLYEPINAQFSERAHQAARNVLYPIIFNRKPEELLYESASEQQNERQVILDGEMGVDRIVKVATLDLRAPLVFTIQERFRNRYGKVRPDGTRLDYTKYEDLTITEWNHASDLPSELYKINAGYFLYAYYDEENDLFLHPIMINVADLLYALTQNSIIYKMG